MTLTTRSQISGSVLGQSDLTYLAGQNQETDTRMLGVGSGAGISVTGTAHVTNIPSVGDGYVSYYF